MSRKRKRGEGPPDPHDDAPAPAPDQRPALVTIKCKLFGKLTERGKTKVPVIEEAVVRMQIIRTRAMQFLKLYALYLFDEDDDAGFESFTKLDFIRRVITVVCETTLASK